MPIVVLPVAYALTFETQTLNSEDVERVKELGKLRTDAANAEIREAEEIAERSA